MADLPFHAFWEKQRGEEGGGGLEVFRFLSGHSVLANFPSSAILSSSLGKRAPETVEGFFQTLDP